MVEKEFTIIIRLSSISENVIFFSFFLYNELAFIYLSIEYTKAFLTALSGEPPCSKKELLWKYCNELISLLKQNAASNFSLYSGLSSLSLPFVSVSI